MHRKPGRGRESSVRRSAGRAERDRRRRGRGEKRDTRHRTRDTGRVPDTYGTTRPRRPTRSSKASRDMWPPNAPTNMSPSARRNRSTAADSVTALTSSTYACAFVRARAGACKVGTNTGPHKHRSAQTQCARHGHLLCVYPPRRVYGPMHVYGHLLPAAALSWPLPCASTVPVCLHCRVPPLSLSPSRFPLPLSPSFHTPYTQPDSAGSTSGSCCRQLPSRVRIDARQLHSGARGTGSVGDAVGEGAQPDNDYTDNHCKTQDNTHEREREERKKETLACMRCSMSQELSNKDARSNARQRTASPVPSKACTRTQPRGRKRSTNVHMHVCARQGAAKLVNAPFSARPYAPPHAAVVQAASASATSPLAPDLSPSLLMRSRLLASARRQRTQACTHTCARTCIHAHAHVHAYTHMHTYAPGQPRSYPWQDRPGRCCTGQPCVG